MQRKSDRIQEQSNFNGTGFEFEHGKSRVVKVDCIIMEMFQKGGYRVFNSELLLQSLWPHTYQEVEYRVPENTRKLYFAVERSIQESYQKKGK